MTQNRWLLGEDAWMALLLSLEVTKVLAVWQLWNMEGKLALSTPSFTIVANYASTPGKSLITGLNGQNLFVASQKGLYTGDQESLLSSPKYLWVLDKDTYLNMPRFKSGMGKHRQGEQERL